jgi:hypothetical protein
VAVRIDTPQRGLGFTESVFEFLNLVRLLQMIGEIVQSRLNQVRIFVVTAMRDLPLRSPVRRLACSMKFRPRAGAVSCLTRVQVTPFGARSFKRTRILSGSVIGGSSVERGAGFAESS